MTTLVVFGASGNVGFHVLTSLLELLAAGRCAGDVRIRAVSRAPEDLRARLDLKGAHAAVAGRLDIICGDVTQAEDLTRCLVGTQRAFLCLPQSLSSQEMVAVSKAVADEGVRQGVQHIVRISALGIDATGVKSNVSSQGSLGNAHVEGESYIRSQGLTLTSVRPTSFHTNFEKYDLPSVREESRFASPLGNEAAVNWVACSDIAAVAAHALVESSLDGRVLDVTGPASSTLTAEAMRAILSAKLGRDVRYQEVEPPPTDDLNNLWSFLRGGGFDVHTSVVKDVTGKEPRDVGDWLDELNWRGTEENSNL